MQLLFQIKQNIQKKNLMMMIGCQMILIQMQTVNKPIMNLILKHKKKNQPNALFKKKSSQGESSRRAPCWKYFETIYNEKEGREYDYCLVTLVDGTRCREAYVHNGATKNHNRHLKKKHEIKEIKYLDKMPVKKLNDTQQSLINMLVSGLNFI